MTRRAGSSLTNLGLLTVSNQMEPRLQYTWLSERQVSVTSACSWKKRLHGKHAYLNTPTAGAILRMLRDERGMSGKTLHVCHETPDTLCQLDPSTVLALSLIRDWDNEAPTWSLFSVIQEHLKLKSGKRLLRASLLQPLVSEPTITERQNAIAELLSLPETQSSIRDFLGEIPQNAHQCLPSLSRLHASHGTSAQLVHAVLAVKLILCQMQVSPPTEVLATASIAMAEPQLLSACRLHLRH
jgi:DNA mismatch repair ATPase MutS